MVTIEVNIIYNQIERETIMKTPTVDRDVHVKHIVVYICY